MHPSSTVPLPYTVQRRHNDQSRGTGCGQPPEATVLFEREDGNVAIELCRSLPRARFPAGSLHCVVREGHKHDGIGFSHDVCIQYSTVARTVPRGRADGLPISPPVPPKLLQNSSASGDWGKATKFHSREAR